MTVLSLFGSKGKQVKNDQKLLNLAGAKLKVDGKFGPKTKKATLEFQKKHGLENDAVIGPITRYELMWYKYPHFNKEEFKCKCGGKYCNGYPKQVDEKLLILLEKIRKKCGNKAINITSGLRCKQHNKNEGGVYDSQHLYGTAADIKARGVSKVLLEKYVYNLILKVGLVLLIKLLCTWIIEVIKLGGKLRTVLNGCAYLIKLLTSYHLL